MQLHRCLPGFSAELTTLLIAAGEPDLAAQVNGLQMVERCSCEDDFCSSFRTEPKPKAGYGPDHRNVSLEPEQGMIILDVVNDHIVFVEVPDRPDVLNQLINLDWSV